MKLTLSQNELELAVRAYVTGMISLQPGTEVTIDFKAGRGENGISAEVDISHLALAGAGLAAAAPVAVVAQPEPIAAAPAPATSAKVSKPTPVTLVKEAPISTATANVDEEAAPEKPATEVRKTSGKSLFGAGAAASDAPAANDGESTDGAAAEEEPPFQQAAAAGGRKTLFSQ
ncbi:hypothetical protein [Dyella sp. ASV21]|uniref:hypothetical protein n=1 Tax=Dyella sp. ASV21 TaxID=2795114 RepID=UPI0018EB4AE1|nr:hypothetical protein [Dyella sp. ASV21]